MALRKDDGTIFEEELDEYVHGQTPPRPVARPSAARDPRLLVCSPVGLTVPVIQGAAAPRVTSGRASDLDTNSSWGEAPCLPIDIGFMASATTRRPGYSTPGDRPCQ